MADKFLINLIDLARWTVTITLQEKFSGCLLGMAVGDAIGFELQYDGSHGGLWEPGGMLAEHVADFAYGSPFGLRGGQYTDDTQMALAMARSIARLGHVDAPAIAKELAELWTSQEVIGASRACTLSVCNLLEGTSWDEIGMPPGEQSNCAAKRVAPVGLFHAGGDRSELIDDVEVTTIITHHDACCIAGALVLASSIAAVAAEGPLPAESLLPRLEETLVELGANGGFRDHLSRMPDWLTADEHAAVAEIARAGREEFFHASFIVPHVLPSVLVCLYAALKSDWDFCEALSVVFRAQGDVDSTGAMTGALTGAAGGIEAVPERLRMGLQDRDRIEATASGLYDAAATEE